MPRRPRKKPPGSGPGRIPILQLPPEGYEPLTDEEFAAYRPNGPRFLQQNRQKGWMLALAERHRLVPIRSSVISRNSLVRLLLPDLFPSTFREAARYTRDISDLDLALSSLGETRLIKVKTEKGLPPTLRVEASHEADAVDHLARLGLEPVKPRKPKGTPRKPVK
ncbi:MAG: hypothetical protein ACQEVT_16755 [Pseudomonadota bacterium]